MDIDDQDTTMMDVVDDVDGEENTTRRGSPTKRERNRDDNTVEAGADGDAGSKPSKKAKANTATSSSFVTVPTTASSSSKASQSMMMMMMMKKEEPQPSTSTSVLSPSTTERARDKATVSSVENLTTQPPSSALPTKTGASGAAATTAASAPTTTTTASTGKDNKVATPETVEPSSSASSSSSVTFVGNPAVFMWTCKFVLVVVVALLTFNGTLSSVRMSLEATLSSSSSSSSLIDSSTATNNSDNDGILSGTTSNNEAAATTATTMDTNTIKNSHRKIVLSFSMTEEENDADETVSDEEDPVLLYWIQIQDTAIKKGTMQEYLFHPVETFGTNRQARHSFPGHIFVAGQPLNQNDGSNNNDNTNNDVHNICSWAVWTMPTPEDDDDDPFIVTVVLEKKKKNPNSNDVSIIPGLVACGDIDNNNTDEL